jgi:large subunit ribosomal protein L15
MPLHRRIPKRGFRNPFGTDYAIVNVESLNVFASGANVTPEGLLERRIVRQAALGVIVLGAGELKVALTVRAHRFSKSAEQKIVAAGGKVELLK